MTTLEQSLHKYDLGHLRIIAQFWGVELQAGERSTAREELSEKLLNESLATEVIEALPAEARRALNSLLENQGRIPWAAFARQFGEIRDLGPGRRDREKSYLSPVSAAEMLFYRSLLARAFFDSPSGAQEFAYIPDDLLKIIHEEHEAHEEKKVLGRLARPDERAFISLANDHILDDLTTLLAALRVGWEEPPFPLDTSPRFARDLLLAARLIFPSPSGGGARGGGGGSIQPDSVKSFLEADRADALAQLTQIWRESESINELWQVPSLICEGEWINPILDTRKAVLGFLEMIPRGKWWSLKAFIADIKERQPDFQRKAGEYDAWFIRRVENSKGFNRDIIEPESLPSKSSHKEHDQIKPFGSQKDLRGFEHWDEVEGALIHYFVTGVLYWLGMVDLAASEEAGKTRAFRIREKTVPERSAAQKKDGVGRNRSYPKGTLSSALPIGRSAQRLEGKIIVTSSGQISISRFSPRVARYQISRFCEWEKSKNPDEYKYQITPSSLECAREQGLKVSHLLALLKKFADTEIPPVLGRALRRWEVNGTEARVETLSVLRLSKPEDLRALRESKAGRFLGEVLGPTAVVVKAGASSKIMAALIEMGIFMDDE